MPSAYAYPILIISEIRSLNIIFSDVPDRFPLSSTGLTSGPHHRLVSSSLGN